MRANNIMLASFMAGLFCLLACDSPGKRQNLKRLYGEVMCLDVYKTEKTNNIHIGNGKLIFNEDKTFLVTNDSAKYSNVKGTWDLCCSESDYGNYVFTVEGHEPLKTVLPIFYINVDGKEVQLIFTNCQ